MHTFKMVCGWRNYLRFRRNHRADQIQHRFELAGTVPFTKNLRILRHALTLVWSNCWSCGTHTDRSIYDGYSSYRSCGRRRLEMGRRSLRHNHRFRAPLLVVGRVRNAVTHHPLRMRFALLGIAAPRGRQFPFTTRFLSTFSRNIDKYSRTSGQLTNLKGVQS